MARTTFTDDFRRNFLTGVAALFPVVITLFLFSWLYRALDSTLGEGANTACRQLIARPRGVFEVCFPHADEEHAATLDGRIAYARQHFPRIIGTFLVLIVGVVAVYLMGRAARGYIGSRVVTGVDRFFERFPVIKAVYPYARQVADLVFGQSDRRRFSRVVAIQYPRRGMYSIGFLTGEGLSAVEKGVGEKLVTVFVPTSPTPLTGFIVQLPADEVTPVALSVDEAFRYCLTAGMVTSGKGGGPSAIAAPKLETPAGEGVADTSEDAVGKGLKPDTVETDVAGEPGGSGGD